MKSTMTNLYWKDRLAQRMEKADEVSRLVVILRGFYLLELGSYSSLFEFYESKRPYGDKDIAASIAFYLGWDRDRMLCKVPMPKWVREQAMELHTLVGEDLIREHGPTDRVTCNGCLWPSGYPTPGIKQHRNGDPRATGPYPSDVCPICNSPFGQDWVDTHFLGKTTRTRIGWVHPDCAARNDFQTLESALFYRAFTGESLQSCTREKGCLTVAEPSSGQPESNAMKNPHGLLLFRYRVDDSQYWFVAVDEEDAKKLIEELSINDGFSEECISGATLELITDPTTMGGWKTEGVGGRMIALSDAFINQKERCLLCQSE
jgi:hypothetical protein